MIKTLFKYSPVIARFADEIDAGDEGFAGDKVTSGSKVSDEDKISDDLYCTAIGRAIKKGKKIIIDCRRHRCDGGNFFVGGKEVPIREIHDVYVKKENVLSGEGGVRDFLSACGRNPRKSKYLVLERLGDSYLDENKALNRAMKESDIVLGIMRADNIGRLLGLAAYLGIFNVDVVPAISTCSALYRPYLKPNLIHINFIDYFDRKYQCKGYFEEDEVLISMSSGLFKRISDVYEKSSHGGNVPKDVPVFKVEDLDG